MKIVVAIDSLKGSLSSLEAGEAIKSGVLRAIPDADVCVRPLADGGEGTVEALALGMGGKLESTEVTGPLGEKVNCLYGILEESKTAIIEMSGAAGITLVPDAKRNPLHTTTYGVGEVIKDTISKGCRHFIVGIGGSATNDGGIGMLQALGYGMLDKDGIQVPFGAKGLKEIETITDDHVIPELKECSFRIACDVTNTLCGEFGCSAVFGPQKGADPTMIIQMDKWLANYDFTTLGAIVGLVIAIVLIIKKVSPAYSLILGALLGGIIGGGGLVTTVNTMVSGASSMMSSVLRIMTSGILAGALIKTGSAEKIAETIVTKLGEKRALFAISIATMIICAVGVFIDISVITVAPIAIAIGRKVGLTNSSICRSISCYHLIGTSSNLWYQH